MRNVLDFGAKGDGITKDTESIQAALDAGGMVCVPPGTYLTGTLYLRSHGGLYLESGATLKASPDKEDYNARDFCPQNSWSEDEKAYGGHLIVALEQEDVTICGEGTIDGSFASFIDFTQPDRELWNGWRPSQMVFICECQYIRIRDVRMINSPYWNCFILGCDDVQIRGITIREHPDVWNGDGIDIDCSRRVIVSDCDITSSDDSLTIRASCVDRLRKSPGITDHVTVTNCILSSNQAAIRFGVGDGEIRNCVLSNVTVERGLYGVIFMCTWHPEKFKTRGTDIHDVLLDNFIIHAHTPFDFAPNWVLPPLDRSESGIRNVCLRNILAYGDSTNIIKGNRDFNVSDVEFSDVTLNMTGGDAIVQDPAVIERDLLVYQRPYAFHVINAERIRFRRFICRWQAESDKWESAFYLKNDHDVTFEECHIDPPRNGCPVISGDE